jgi:hypothetical protein
LLTFVRSSESAESWARATSAEWHFYFIRWGGFASTDAYGLRIGMLVANSGFGGRLSKAVKAGVFMYACKNTMHGQMNPDVCYALSGAHLIRRQAEGYAYISA